MRWSRALFRVRSPRCAQHRTWHAYPSSRPFRRPTWGSRRFLPERPPRAPRSRNGSCTLSRPTKEPPFRAGRSAGSCEPTKCKIFDLEKLLDAVSRAFASDSTLFHAAERGHLCRDDSFIDSDDAVFQRLGHSHDSAHVPRVEVCG